MKCSLGISNFLEEISSLSHSVVLYFFALVDEEGFLISPYYFWKSAFKWVYLSFSPLVFTSLLFTAICKASPDSHFAFLHFFSVGMMVGGVCYISVLLSKISSLACSLSLFLSFSLHQYVQLLLAVLFLPSASLKKQMPHLAWRQETASLSCFFFRLGWKWRLVFGGHAGKKRKPRILPGEERGTGSSENSDFFIFILKYLVLFWNIN